MEKLDFAKYYDVTELAKKHRPNNYNSYEKIYVCVDTHDFWIGRVQTGWRDDEEEGYVQDNDAIILERNNIAKISKGSGINSLKELLDLFDEDDLSNWDVHNVESIEDAEEMLDNGFGLNRLDIEGNLVSQEKLV